MTDSSPHSDTGTLLAANLSGTPGITLRLAREKSGQTLNEMASRTKIPVSVLEAIEHDDTAKLGQPVYARGYLRKYAAALNVPESRVLGAFDSWQAARQNPADAGREESEPVEQERASHPMLWILLIVILAAVAGALVLYFKGGSLSAITRRPAITRPARVQRPPVQTPAPAPAPTAAPAPEALEPRTEPEARSAPAAQSTPAAPKPASPATENAAVPGGPPPVNQPEPGPVSPPPAPR